MYSDFGQQIWKFFIVQSVKKSVSGVDVTLIQLHNLSSNDLMATLYEGDEPYMLLGDLNLDGFVDILDVVTMISGIVEGTELPEQADINQDGYINVLDVVAMTVSIIT